MRPIVSVEQPPLTAAEGLARLKEGNERFVRGQARFPTVQKDVLAGSAKGTRPYATVLGCSESGVAPELVFDAAFGELFVVRNAGNVLGPSILGSLQYAGSVLCTPLFVVLGHEGCGAVAAAIASRFHGLTRGFRLEVLLEEIVPALDHLDAEQPPEALLHAAVEANVRHTMRALRRTPEARTRLALGDMKLVGAVHDIATGRVRFLDPQ